MSGSEFQRGVRKLTSLSGANALPRSFGWESLNVRADSARIPVRFGQSQREHVGAVEGELTSSGTEKFERFLPFSNLPDTCLRIQRYFFLAVTPSKENASPVFFGRGEDNAETALSSCIEYQRRTGVR